MLKNYLLIALRHLLHNKVYSLINIVGLSIGLACTMLIILFVKDELSYDRFNKDSDRIFRVVKDFVNDDGTRLPDATTPPALAPTMQKELPEIAATTRIFPSWGFKDVFSYKDKKFIEERVFRVDSNFFDVFTIPFVQGNMKSAFTDHNSILLTESSAKKYFGSEDPMHKMIHTDIGDLRVTGIVKDIPANAHFHFDFLLSVRKFSDPIDTRWGWYNFYTYFKLKPNASAAGLTPKIQALYKKNNADGKNIFYTQALTDIHLGSNLKWEIEANSDKLYVFVFSLIAVFIITIACINYINLATAKSALRAKEIGIRKVSGAFRASLIRQFLMESVLTVYIAFLLAILFTQLLIPVANQLTQKHLSLLSFANPKWILSIFGVVTAIGISAGIYPAIYLSSFRPVLVLKGFTSSEKRLFNLRKVLVVSQFTISAALIIGTLIVVQQIHFIQNAKLGLNKDQVMIISNAGNLSRSNREALMLDLLKVPGVKRTATANGVVGGQNWTTELKSKGSENGQLVNFLGVSYDYLNVVGIELKEGRNFSPAFPTDTTSVRMPALKERITGSLILNERAVRDLGIPEPAIGRLVNSGTDHDTTLYMTIVGVTKDFHFASFKSEIKPFAFLINNDWQDNFTLKVGASDLKNTISQVEKRWNVFAPGRPFQYSFLDETFAGLYQSEKRFNQVFLSVTALIIIIACMGLFGLTTFMVEKRTREIGIRKVIGASVTNIITLLSWDFVKLVLISIIIATPIAWFTMNQWLQSFAYRIHISWWIFLVAGLLAIMISLITVGFQAVKAAVANPVKSLKTE